MSNVEYQEQYYIKNKIRLKKYKRKHYRQNKGMYLKNQRIYRKTKRLKKEQEGDKRI